MEVPHTQASIVIQSGRVRMQKVSFRSCIASWLVCGNNKMQTQHKENANPAKTGVLGPNHCLLLLPGRFCLAAPPDDLPPPLLMPPPLPPPLPPRPPLPPPLPPPNEFVDSRSFSFGLREVVGRPNLVSRCDLVLPRPDAPPRLEEPPLATLLGRESSSSTPISNSPPPSPPSSPALRSVREDQMSDL